MDYNLFISYSRDNESWVRKFVQVITEEYLQQTGEELEVFKDSIKLHAGARWKKRIYEAIELSSCMVAVLSPSYFKSEFCQTEWEQFKKRERILASNELIIPVYHIFYKEFSNRVEEGEESWISDLQERQYCSLIKHRLDGLSSRGAKHKITMLVNNIVHVLSKSEESISTPLIGENISNIEQYDGVVRIVEWFKGNYSQRPNRSIDQVLDWIFEAILFAQNTGHYNIYKEVERLGKELRKCLPDAIPENQRFHRDILELIELGLHHHLSHLFMIPEIDKRSLARVPAYSKLLLATRYLAAGRYDELGKLNLIQELQGSALALYIRGQVARKQGVFEKAKHLFDESIKVLNRFGKDATSYAQLVCEENLLRAEILRGISVVQREQGDSVSAERYCNEATLYAEKSRQELTKPDHCTRSSDRIDVEQELSRRRVVANVHFSCGYRVFKEKKYDSAENLFSKSYETLKDANEKWGAPVARLAIVKLCKGNVEEAKEKFVIGREWCELEGYKKNREAPLTRALCGLGLQVIERVYGSMGSVIEADFVAELEDALALKPRLAVGPLKCHLQDASHFKRVELTRAQDLVDCFSCRIEREAGVL